jgi:hypothetical protein
MKLASFCCEINQEEGISGCAREWGGGWEGKQRLGLTYGAGIERVCPQACGAPASDFSVVRRRFREGAKGDGRGQRGGLIAAARRRLMQAMKELKRGGSNGSVSAVSEEGGQRLMTT